MNKKKDIMIIGFALFSMFFGAGNLLLPPTIGFNGGASYLLATIGFILTAVGLPILGVIVIVKGKGDLLYAGRQISVTFSEVIIFIILIAIGPLLAIPRTAATTYEVGMRTLVPGLPPLVGNILFFAAVLFFVLSPKKILDRLGSYLTPILLITVFLIVCKGVLYPAEQVGPPNKDAFVLGFKSGYQTMDALASIIFTSMIAHDVRQRGYQDGKESLDIVLKSGFVAGICLALVYFGLILVGAKMYGQFDLKVTRVDLLTGSTKILLGTIGQIVLSMAMALACLTTAIGLTATCADHFSRKTKGKISYRVMAIGICVFSLLTAVKGVDDIILFSAPILELLYPVIMALLICTLFEEKFRNNGFYIGSVVASFVISVLSLLVSYEPLLTQKFGQNATALSEKAAGLYRLLPLHNVDLAWILPSIILGALIYVFKGNRAVKSIE